MRINIEHLINQATARIKSDTCAYGYVLKEFVKHLKILRDEHQKGNCEEALNEFFRVYVFSDNQCGDEIEK